MGLTAAKCARTFAPLADEPWALFFPQGPYPLEIRSDTTLSVGFAWYMYRGDEEEWNRYLVRTERHLLDRLDEVIGTGRVDRDRVFLIGHSQGCYLGYTLALRHPHRFRGYVAIGGRLKLAFLETHLESARDLPILILHGSEDRSVPAESAVRSRALLAERGFRVECRVHPTGHWVHPAQVRDAREWIHGRLEEIDPR